MAVVRFRWEEIQRVMASWSRLWARRTTELALSTDAGTLSVTIQSLAERRWPRLLADDREPFNDPNRYHGSSHGPERVARRHDNPSAGRSYRCSQLCHHFHQTSLGEFQRQIRSAICYAAGVLQPERNVQRRCQEAVGPGWTWGLEGEPDFVPAVVMCPRTWKRPWDESFD